jgi:hypothetical protein
MGALSGIQAFPVVKLECNRQFERGAMERRVTVNDGIEQLELDVPPELEAAEDVRPARPAGSLGPCLYLGPRGERCSHPAVEGGYCTKHSGAPAAGSPVRSYTRVLAATLALIVVIWPYVSDLVRDLFRWLAGSH